LGALSFLTAVVVVVDDVDVAELADDVTDAIISPSLGCSFVVVVVVMIDGLIIILLLLLLMMKPDETNSALSVPRLCQIRRPLLRNAVTPYLLVMVLVLMLVMVLMWCQSVVRSMMMDRL